MFCCLTCYATLTYGEGVFASRETGEQETQMQSQNCPGFLRTLFMRFAVPWDPKNHPFCPSLCSARLPNGFSYCRLYIYIYIYILVSSFQLSSVLCIRPFCQWVWSVQYSMLQSDKQSLTLGHFDQKEKAREIAKRTRKENQKARVGGSGYCDCDFLIWASKITIRISLSLQAHHNTGQWKQGPYLGPQKAFA